MMTNAKKVLVLIEHTHQQLKPSSLNAITAAKQLCDDITALVVGYQCTEVADEVASLDGVRHVLVADNQIYQYLLAENVSALIHSLACDYAYILAPATTFGKNILPRVAALLDVGCLSDVIQIVSEDTFVRPIYAGNALQTIQSSDPIKLMTVRTTAFSPEKGRNNKAVISQCHALFDALGTEFVSQELTVSTRPSLTSARVIISGGRGMGSAENFQLILSLADKLGAAVGASRAAVDAGFVPNDYQVGQTGKVVAPDLYIAIGISGAIQHIAGMKDSKVIVAINKDRDAPIFKIADYGLVGDLFEIIPMLEKAIDTL